MVRKRQGKVDPIGNHWVKRMGARLADRRLSACWLGCVICVFSTRKKEKEVGKQKWFDPSDSSLLKVLLLDYLFFLMYLCVFK